MRRFFLIVLTFYLLSGTNNLFADDSEILSSVSTRTVDGDKLIIVDSLLIQVNNRKGDDAAKFYIPYSKKDKISIDDAWIEDMQGNVIRKLKGKDITTASYIPNGALYQDYYLKHFELRNNVYPYKVFVSYKIIENDFLNLTYWEACRSIDESVRSAKLLINVPNDFPVSYKLTNIDEPKKESTNGRTVYTWDTSYKANKQQNYAAREVLNIPKVIANPLHFKYGIKGSWESWESFGAWIKELNSGKQELPQTEKEKISRLISGLSDPREKVEVLYKYLQDNTRYILVAINIGGLQTYPASYVAEKKYGDCKALTNYMMSMLQYVGIPSYYTLIQLDKNIEEIDYRFPAQVFNHVILTVPLKDETLFLECTDKNSPPGYLGTSTQGRSALVIDNPAYFIQTPAMSVEDVKSSSVVNFKVSNDVTLAHIKAIERSNMYEAYTFIEKQTRISDKEKYLRYTFPGSYEVKDFNIELNPGNLPEAHIDADIELKNIIKGYNNNIIVSPFSRELPVLETPEERTQDVKFDYPVSYSDTLVYTFPSERKIKSIEAVIESDESIYGNYYYKYIVNENQLTVIKQATINKGLWTLDAYTQLYEFISKIKSLEKRLIHLEYEKE